MNNDERCGSPVTRTKSSDVEKVKGALDSDCRRTYVILLNSAIVIFLSIWGQLVKALLA